MIDQGTGTLAHARGASNLASRARGGGGRTIVHLAAEYYPYARTGGLAEAVAGLAEQQARDGEAVVVFMPLYPSARATAGDLQPVGPSLVVPLGELREPVRFLRDAARTHGPEVVFIDAPGYFARSGLYGEDGQDYADNHRRFALFSRAALDGIRAAVPGPVLVHAHDWHAAFAPIFMRTSADLVPTFVDAPAILSVHNAGYQGHFPPSAMADLQLPPELWTMDRLEWFGRLNVLKGGIVYADLVVTVSPSHAEELCTPEGGFGLDELFRALGPRLVGITNGIDQSVWSPATDPEIAANYTAHDLRGKGECRAALQRRFGLIPDPSAPIFGMSSRLVKQKGFDLLLQSEFVQRGPAQFAILGMGDPGYHVALRALADALPGRAAVEFRFTEALVHVV
ncbi:MAG TPA: glycogen/starch synthase, partial [Gemmatimonadaceae bacterium]|nr:glycogen/starch synthase [Gemmatimonadaceae bacterium]